MGRCADEETLVPGQDDPDVNAEADETEAAQDRDFRQAGKAGGSPCRGAGDHDAGFENELNDQGGLEHDADHRLLR